VIVDGGQARRSGPGCPTAVGCGGATGAIFGLLAVAGPAILAGGALPACGGGSSAAHDAGADTASTCPPSDAGEPATVPAHLSFDGGVPIYRLAGALAVVRCNYLAKCFSLASYVASECVEQMTQGNA
jgi:hypothetical protein